MMTSCDDLYSCSGWLLPYLTIILAMSPVSTRLGGIQMWSTVLSFLSVLSLSNWSHCRVAVMYPRHAPMRNEEGVSFPIFKTSVQFSTRTRALYTSSGGMDWLQSGS